MERKAINIIIFYLFVCLTALDGSYKSDIYTAFVKGNMGLWKNVIDEMSASVSSMNFIPELINYQYGYIGWCITVKKFDEAKKYLEQAEENLKTMVNDPGYGALVNSYLSAFYAYRIGMNKILAPVLGPKSLDCANKALKLDDNEPMAYIQSGNMYFYRPFILGGSKSRALEYYLKALEIMEKDLSSCEENWNYLSLLIVIAQSYSYLDDYNSSLNYLQRILKIEPDFPWVKNEFYPRVLNKMHK